MGSSSQRGKIKNLVYLINISSNQLCSNFFSKNVTFTKFLQKSWRVKFRTNFHTLLTKLTQNHVTPVIKSSWNLKKYFLSIRLFVGLHSSLVTSCLDGASLLLGSSSYFIYWFLGKMANGKWTTRIAEKKEKDQFGARNFVKLES